MGIVLTARINCPKSPPSVYIYQENRPFHKTNGILLTLFFWNISETLNHSRPIWQSVMGSKTTETKTRKKRKKWNHQNQNQNNWKLEPKPKRLKIQNHKEKLNCFDFGWSIFSFFSPLFFSSSFGFGYPFASHHWLNSTNLIYKTRLINFLEKYLWKIWKICRIKNEKFSTH